MEVFNRRSCDLLGIRWKGNSSKCYDAFCSLSTRCRRNAALDFKEKMEQLARGSTRLPGKSCDGSHPTHGLVIAGKLSLEEQPASPVHASESKGDQPTNLGQLECQNPRQT